jgi:protoporphyrinogen/coproporphyrinogen III oxidase
MKVAILGAGISGLAAAWFLKRRYKKGISITLFEKSERPGGWIRTHREGDFLFELGPSGFRGKGEATLELVHELGLTKELVVASKTMQKRYIALKGKLTLFSLPFLLRQNLIGAVLRDLFTTLHDAEDESIAAFTSRRFNRNLAERLMDPLVKGIFGGDAHTLSVRHCFPLLWKWEQEYGSVTRGWLASRKKRKRESIPALYSFQEGMECLPKRLAEKLDASILFSTTVHSFEEIDADHVISTLPGYALAKLLKREDPFTYTTLSLVNCGWNQKVLQKRGYGFLVPSSEKGDILGMVWDSEIFPMHNRAKQTRICVMIQGAASEERLLHVALKSLQHYLQITIPPDVMFTYTARDCIPQYTLNHHRLIRAFKKECPRRVSLIGTCFEGVGINECIFNTKRLADGFSL